MKKLITVLFVVFTLSQVFAQSSEVFTTDEGAIRGYDPVAYFKEGKPLLGKKEFSTQWKGAQWSFSSKQNLEAFKSNPEKYAPQYGGYCAYGTSEGHKAPTQPDAFTIVNNKLYLNYNKDVKVEWSKNQKERIVKADQNWPAVKKQK
ncbi:MAG TPA: YHS domain-containing (seleno)protein [Cyclobacteriaceae bacterium]|nr:YHS domain-containing (seleno)protein [Cyclobacteriaceae bacterium]